MVKSTNQENQHPLLGVNVDHVATLRQARREDDPDPVEAALICESAGADSIVCHLREDRRHIQDDDVVRLKKKLTVPLTLELALDAQIIRFAADLVPSTAMFVPERRQEITTEGGLDVLAYRTAIENAIKTLKSSGILISLFVDPNEKHIHAAYDLGADIVELHTGRYAHASGSSKADELATLMKMSEYAASLGLKVSAGHGLKYHDVRDVAMIKTIEELNIGHSIVSRSITTGLFAAVREMKDLLT